MPKLFGAPARKARRHLELAKMRKRLESQSKRRLIKRSAALDRLINEQAKTEKKLGEVEDECFWIAELRGHGKDREAQSLIESRKQLKAKMAEINRRIKIAANLARRSGG